MIPLDLTQARALASSERMASGPEYLRQILRVLLAIHDAPRPAAEAPRSTHPPKR